MRTRLPGDGRQTPKRPAEQLAAENRERQRLMSARGPKHWEVWLKEFPHDGSVLIRARHLHNARVTVAGWFGVHHSALKGRIVSPETYARGFGP